MSEQTSSQAAPLDSPPADLTAQYESLLASGERVLTERRRHWVTFIQAARWFILVIAVGIAAGVLNGKIGNGGGVSGFFSNVLTWGFVICLVIGLAGVGWFYLAWRRERYLVTTRRVIEIGGILNKYSRDTTLSMINDMIVGQPLIGRILGYGEIDLLTAAEAGTNKIRFLPDADGFKRSLLDAKHQHELEVGGGGAVAQAAASPASPAAPASDRLSADEVEASITHLADLRDRGLITAAEFEEKKKEILGRL
jgi:uncharacterized membrane protein YdbT with pleckstrin-like domain